MDEFEKTLLHMIELQRKHNGIPEWAKAEKLECIIPQIQIWRIQQEIAKENSLVGIREKIKSIFE